jgi:methylenetetrahydrofolate reductase (NADPH)
MLNITPPETPSPSRPGATLLASSELLANISMEVTLREAAAIDQAAPLLPAGSCVYVPSLSGQPLARALEVLAPIHRHGLDPVPHVAARRVPGRAQVLEFLAEAVVRHGVHRVMLIGGDEPQPLGPYASAADLLRSGVLREAGVREIGVAAYPEGHPKIPQAELRRAFDEKRALAREQGLGLYVVTQFSFAPERIVALCNDLAHRAPEVPVYVGMPGPSDPVALLRYAQRCGVSASRRALSTLGTGIARLVAHTDPGDQLAAVAHYCDAHPDGNVVGVHLFSFGGAVRTARWVDGLRTGRSPGQ